MENARESNKINETLTFDRWINFAPLRLVAVQKLKPWIPRALLLSKLFAIGHDVNVALLFLVEGDGARLGPVFAHRAALKGRLAIACALTSASISETCIHLDLLRTEL